MTFHFFITIAYMTPMWLSIFLLDNVEDMTQLFYISLTEVALFVKLVNLFVRNKEFQRCFDKINDAEFQPSSNVEKELADFMQGMFGKLIFFYAFISLFCAMLSGILPLFSGTNQLPWFLWFYGIDYKHNMTIYYILWAYQHFGMVCHASLNVINDLFLPFFMNFVNIQFDFIANRMELLDSDDKDFHEKLIKNVKYHQAVVKFTDEISIIYSFPMFIQFCMSGFVICFTAFQISLVSIKDPF